MAPTFRSATQGTGVLPNIVPTKPAGVVDGDLLLVFVAFYMSGSTHNVTGVPSGWTLLRTQNNFTARNHRTSVYWKIATSEPSSWTFVVDDSFYGQAWACIAVSSPVGPGYIADHQGSNETAAATAHPAPSVNAASSTDLLVYALGGFGPASATEPAGFTERADVYESTAPNLIEVATKAAGAAGATGTVTGTTPTAYGCETILVAVNGLAAVTFAPPHPIYLQTTAGWASIVEGFVSGTGAPTAGVGVNGAIYLDTATGRMYGPKAAGAWPATSFGRLLIPGNTYNDVAAAYTNYAKLLAG